MAHIMNLISNFQSQNTHIVAFPKFLKHWFSSLILNQTKMDGGIEQHLPKTDDWQCQVCK